MTRKKKYPPMDAKAKVRWLEALRSGKYKQARDVLRDKEGKMCCLGVIATVVDGNAYSATTNVNVRGEMLDIGAYGLSEEIQDQLAALNDKKGIGFLTIARWIEERL